MQQPKEDGIDALTEKQLIHLFEEELEKNPMKTSHSIAKELGVDPSNFRKWLHGERGSPASANAVREWLRPKYAGIGQLCDAHVAESTVESDTSKEPPAVTTDSVTTPKIESPKQQPAQPPSSTEQQATGDASTVKMEHHEGPPTPPELASRRRNVVGIQIIGASVHSFVCENHNTLEDSFPTSNSDDERAEEWVDVTHPTYNSHVHANVAANPCCLSPEAPKCPHCDAAAAFTSGMHGSGLHADFPPSDELREIDRLLSELRIRQCPPHRYVETRGGTFIYCTKCGNTKPL